MKQYFEAVDACNPNFENRTALIVDGSGLGNRMVWSDGKIVFEDDTEGFLHRHAKELCNAGTGIVAIEGRRIYTEQLGNQKKLLICGAGHVSIPIIRIGRMIGFQITVIEDRPQFAENARQAGADTVICAPFEEALGQVPGDADTFFVVVTRGHQWDTQCLRTVARKPHAYIGMMGSARRVRIVKDQLLTEGLDPDVIADVHSPIGLKIGAATPEEIAVSIMAEIIQVKSANKSLVYPPEILRSINGRPMEPPQPVRKILATIVSKQGSAPREVGARMLITEDEKQIGTIGGGCTEASVLQQIRQMFAQEQNGPRLIRVELMADEAAEEGEVCGGVVEIWLEEI